MPAMSGVFVGDGMGVAVTVSGMGGSLGSG